MKKKVTLLMEDRIVKKAKEVGINISQFCENQLKKAIDALEGTSKESNPKEESPHSTKVLKDGGQISTCRRVGGQLPGESLRKLHPSSRTAGPRGLGREARL